MFVEEDELFSVVSVHGLKLIGGTMVDVFCPSYADLLVVAFGSSYNGKDCWKNDYKEQKKKKTEKHTR